jgi:hypothetical protein
MPLCTEYGLPTRRRTHEVPAHAAELMRAWAQIGSIQGTRSRVGDPDRIWGRVLASLGRPGPAGAPIEDLAVLLRNGIHLGSSATGEDDPTSADSVTAFHPDATGTREGTGDTTGSAAGTAGTRFPSADGGNRPRIVGRTVTSVPITISACSPH